MIQLSTCFSDEETNVLSKYTGNNFEVLSYIEGVTYVLSENGEYCYNDCFDATDNDYFAQQKYGITFSYFCLLYQYYLMNTKEEINSWYRGRKDSNGNWEYDCVSDSLEEAFECL